MVSAWCSVTGFGVLRERPGSPAPDCGPSLHSVEYYDLMLWDCWGMGAKAGGYVYRRGELSNGITREVTDQPKHWLFHR